MFYKGEMNAGGSYGTSGYSNLPYIDDMDDAEEVGQGFLSRNKGKIAIGIIVTALVLLILHNAGALSGIEQTLNDKIFTPINAFYDSNRDLILNRILPGVAIGAAAVVVTKIGYSKGKKALNELIEKRAEAKKADWISRGEGAQEANRLVEQNLPQLLDARQKQLEAEEAQAQQSRLVDTIHSTIVAPGISQAGQKVQQKMQQMGLTGQVTVSQNSNAANKVVELGALQTVASFMHEKSSGQSVDGMYRVRIIAPNGGDYREVDWTEEQLQEAQETIKNTGGRIEILEQYRSMPAAKNPDAQLPEDWKVKVKGFQTSEKTANTSKKAAPQKPTSQPSVASFGISSGVGTQSDKAEE